jgi:hypothetical protein
VFWFILIAGVVLYFMLKGKSDRPEVLGAPKRGMGSGPLEPHTFVCPYPKCSACGAPPDKMRQEWDGLRTVKWTCGYCANLAGTQELRDEELPPSARRRLGLDQSPMQPGFQQGPGYGHSGGGAGDLLTGLMIGSMMGGDRHHHHSEGGGSGSDWNSSQGSDSNGGWSDSGNESWGDSGDSGGGSDFGDSGGGDSGGSDW